MNNQVITETNRTDQTNQSRDAKPTEKYGRKGPYPKDRKLFDPLKGTPPGGWHITGHVVGGNCDIPGSRYEKASWAHPQFGELVVEGRQPPKTFNSKEFTIHYSEMVNLLGEIDPRPNMERETAYDTAVEIMVNLSNGL